MRAFWYFGASRITRWLYNQHSCALQSKNGSQSASILLAALWLVLGGMPHRVVLAASFAPLLLRCCTVVMPPLRHSYAAVNLPPRSHHYVIARHSPNPHAACCGHSLAVCGTGMHSLLWHVACCACCSCKSLPWLCNQCSAQITPAWLTHTMRKAASAASAAAVSRAAPCTRCNMARVDSPPPTR